MDKIKYGEFAQVTIAFVNAMQLFGFIVDNFDRIANFLSNGQCLSEIGHVFDFSSGDLETGPSLSALHSEPEAKLLAPGVMVHVEFATLKIPSGESTLVRNLSIDLDQETRLLVVDSSGCGKTSLLWMFSGLWSSASGVVASPRFREG